MKTNEFFTEAPELSIGKESTKLDKFFKTAVNNLLTKIKYPTLTDDLKVNFSTPVGIKGFGSFIKIIMNDPKLSTQNKEYISSFFVERSDMVSKLTILDKKIQQELVSVSQSFRLDIKDLQKDIHGALILAKIPGESPIRFLFDLDLDGVIENNKFATDAGVGWKIAKKQDKKGDDSSVDFGTQKRRNKNERFAGYDNLSLAHAYLYAKNMANVEDDTIILDNVVRSINNNKESFRQYLLYRMHDRKQEDRDAMMNLLGDNNKPMDKSKLDSDKNLKKVIQIYCVDYLRQIDVDPADVFMDTTGSVLQPVNQQSQQGIDNENSPASSNKTSLSNEVLQAIASRVPADMNPEQLLTYNTLQEGQKRWFDLHIAGIYAFMMQNKMTVVNATPLENRDPNADYSDTQTTNEFGSLSVAMTKSIIDRVFTNGHAFHVDFAAIPSLNVNGLGGGTGEFNLTVGPNGSYQIIKGGAVDVTGSVFAGYNVGNKAIAASASVEARINISGKKFGSHHTSLVGGGGIGILGDGKFATAFVGVDIDHIAGIADNVDRISNLAPLLNGLKDKKILLDGTDGDYKEFAKHVAEQNTVALKKREIDDVYHIFSYLSSVAGSVTALTKNNEFTNIVLDLTKQIYANNEKLDLRGNRYGGVNIDVVQLLASPSFWDKARAVFGVLKFKNYKTAITRSGTFVEGKEQSIPQNIDANASVSERQKAIINEYNKALRSIPSIASDILFTQGEGGDGNSIIRIPKSEHIFIDGSASDGTTTVSAQQKISMTVYYDHVKITIKNIESKDATMITASESKKIDLTVPSLDSGLASPIDVNVDVVCQTTEPTLDKWKSAIKKYLDQIPNAKYTKDAVLKHYNNVWGTQYLSQLGINNNTPLLTNLEITSALDGSQKLDYGQLNLWLLRHYGFDRNNNLTSNQNPLLVSDPAYNVYNRLLGYVKTLNTPFLEPRTQDQYLKDKKGNPTSKKNPWAQKGMLRVSNRQIALENFIGVDSKFSRMRDVTKGLADENNDSWYQGFADINNFKTNSPDVTNVPGYLVSAATFNFDHKKGNDGWTPLVYNRFATKLNPDHKTFEGTFICTKITNEVAIQQLKSNILKPSEASRKLTYQNMISKFLTESSTQIQNLCKLGYTVDVSKLEKLAKDYTDDLYDTSDLVIDITSQRSNLPSLGPIKIKRNGDFYAPLNHQCQGNLCGAFVSKWSVEMPNSVTITTQTENEFGGATIRHASEKMNVDNMAKGIKMEGGYGRQNGQYSPSSTPGVDKEKVGDPSSTPGVGTEKSNINGGDTNGSTGNSLDAGGGDASGSAGSAGNSLDGTGSVTWGSNDSGKLSDSEVITSLNSIVNKKSK